MIIINAQLKFKRGVKNLKDYIVLVIVEPKNYQKTNVDILEVLVKEQKIPGVYVTLNKPFNVMQRLLKQKGIDSRMVIFIDCISKVSKNRKRIKNCLFIESPDRLSDISVAMDQAISALPTKEKFLFFDSINTLQLFNKPGTVARFAYFLASKIREWKVKGIIIAVKKDDNQELIDELMQLSDSSIEVEG